MPYGTISDLPDPVRKALPAHGQEIFLAAFNSAYDGTCKDDTDQESCANAIAWSAVKRNYRKNGDEWNKIENLFSNPESIISVHDVTLQRLDVFHNNNGGQVLYPTEQFRNTAAWEGIPVVFDRGCTLATNSEHPSFDVNSPELVLPLGSRFVKVGHVSDVHVPEAGEPVLKGKIAFTCPHCSGMADRKELSLSTGLSAPTMALTNGKKAIAGVPVPNHVLVFKRGACPNCYPNDNGARFENVSPKEVDDMDEESKGFLKDILQKLENLGKHPENKPQDSIMTPEIKTDEQLVNITAERDSLKAKVEQLTNTVDALKKANDDAKQYHDKVTAENADLKWALVKNILPAAWVDTPEHEGATKKEYSEAPHQFAAKLAAFMNQKPGDKPAEGDKMTNVGEVNEDWGTLSYKPEAK